MIGQCLSNKNENATVSKTKMLSELNKVIFVLNKFHDYHFFESITHIFDSFATKRLVPL